MLSQQAAQCSLVQLSVVRHLARSIWDRVWPLRAVAQVAVALLVQVVLVVLVVLVVVHPVPQLLRALVRLPLVRPLVELLWL